MSQNNKLFRKIIGILIVIVSSIIQINVLLQSSSGFLAVITSLAIVIGLKSGEVITAADAAENFKSGNYWLASSQLVLTFIFYSLFAVGGTFFWFSNHESENAKMQSIEVILKAKEDDLKTAKEELSKCPSGMATKCVIPKTQVLTEKQAARDTVLKDFQKLKEKSSGGMAWAKIGKAFGFEDELENNNIEIFKDLVLTMLADLIAIIFIAQAESERKRTGGGNRGGGSGNAGNKNYPLVIDNGTYKIEKDYQQSDLKKSLSVFDDFDDEISGKSKNNVMSEFVTTNQQVRDNVCVVGAKGSGKSTILKKIAEQRLLIGEVIVIDPHANPARWPDGIKIIGAKGNYKEVKKGFETLFKIMQSRNDQYHDNDLDDREFPIITLIVDEISAMKASIAAKQAGLSDVIGDYIADLTSQGRKFGIDMVIGAHTDTAEGFGLNGKAQIINNFDVFAYLDNTDGHRTVLIKLNKKAQGKKYEHPGAYIKKPSQKTSVDFSGQSSINMDYEDDLESERNLEATSLVGFEENESSESYDFSQHLTPEKVKIQALRDKINDAHDKYFEENGKTPSLRTLSQIVWGVNKFGGDYNLQIKDAYAHRQPPIVIE